MEQPWTEALPCKRQQLPSRRQSTHLLMALVQLHSGPSKQLWWQIW